MSWLLPSLPTWSKPPPVAEDPEKQSDEVEDIDAPPAFPLPDSAQRSKAPAQRPAPISVPDFDVSPPSPLSATSSQTATSPPRIRPSTVSSSLQRPTTTTRLPPLPRGGSNASSSTTAKTSTTKKSRKVALAPGCSPLDWARLKASGEVDMRGGYGPAFPMRVTMSELAKHNTPEDAWSAFNGRVYSLNAYLRFHPGGEKELMRVAGRDGTKLFMATHAWVSVEQMMDECLIGFLVSG